MANPDGLLKAEPGFCDSKTGLENGHGVDLDTSFLGKKDCSQMVMAV